MELLRRGVATMLCMLPSTLGPAGQRGAKRFLETEEARAFHNNSARNKKRAWHQASRAPRVSAKVLLLNKYPCWNTEKDRAGPGRGAEEGGRGRAAGRAALPHGLGKVARLQVGLHLAVRGARLGDDREHVHASQVKIGTIHRRDRVDCCV